MEHSFLSINVRDPTSILMYYTYSMSGPVRYKSKDNPWLKWVKYIFFSSSIRGRCFCHVQNVHFSDGEKSESVGLVVETSVSFTVWKVSFLFTI